MHPELFAAGDGSFVLHSYGVFLGLAIVLGAALGMRNVVRAGLPLHQPLLALAFGVPCGFLGARIQYAFVDPAAFDGFLDLLDFRGGRFYSFGAAAGGVIGTLIAARLMRLPMLRLVELLLPGLAVGLAVGRIGCFLAGCGYGEVTELPWGISFPSGSPAHASHVAAGSIPPHAAGSLAVHPTQLLEATLLALLAVVLQRRVAQRTFPPGSVLLTLILSYCALRLGMESLRGDGSRGVYGPLSSTQWTALGTAVAALLVVRLRRTGASPSGSAAGAEQAQP